MKSVFVLRFQMAKANMPRRCCDAVGAVFFEKVDDGFGVAVGAVAMAAGDELLAQGEMVVDFAVEYDPQGAVFV